MKAVLASANPHKLEELAAALPDWELELLGDVDFPPEDGEAYVSTPASRRASAAGSSPVTRGAPRRGRHPG